MLGEDLLECNAEGPLQNARLDPGTLVIRFGESLVSFEAVERLEACKEPISPPLAGEMWTSGAATELMGGLRGDTLE